MEMNNVFILRDIINFGGGQVIGRKKLQKIAYIIQEFTGAFTPPLKYGWNYYGVYSYDLASTLTIGKFFDVFNETPVIDHNYRSYAIMTKVEGQTLSVVENEFVRNLMSFLNSKEPRLLEVLSSIIYFKKEGLSDEAVITKLQEFKGHLSGFYADAYAAVEKIKGMSKEYGPRNGAE